MENESREKTKNLFEEIIKKCREQKFTVGEFEKLVFDLQLALDNRRYLVVKELF